jgi:hypothetical protein
VVWYWAIERAGKANLGISRGFSFEILFLLTLGFYGQV